ncbi:metallophosphoesterase [Nocardioides sp. AE5]|uniref:metallophosphoesterase n=1 Tax=Nocardioides sp. AE5 TaxID=2962573 RepID=UPI0028816C87|nr:metallophosphoesterase [Nocardioides sp. AE5]MDT0201015.1 metallophosphoesterase [Nocardioides sp. AE5]
MKTLATVVLAVLALAVVLALVVGAHWYAGRRLVRDTTRPGTLRHGLAALFLLGPLCLVATIAMQLSGGPFPLRQVLAWPGWLWPVVLMYAVGLLVVADLVRLAWTRRPAAVPAPPEAPERATEPEPGTTSRRAFVTRAVAIGALGLSSATVARGTYAVLRGPRVNHVTVPLARLAPGGDGFRIVLVSDLHLGPTLGRGFATRVVETVNSTRPDLIAVVGDVVDGDVDDLRDAVAPLTGLEAPHGTWFVTGNHEYISGARQWVDHLPSLGITPLRNEHVALEWFDLAGVNDEMGKQFDDGPDYDRALAGRDTSRPVVLLAHQPVQVHEARRRGVDLQLSGHTHGGQVWPGPLVAGWVNPTLAGLERHGPTQLVVSRGAGAWGPPTRVGAPSDITVVTLAAGE